VLGSMSNALEKIRVMVVNDSFYAKELLVSLVKSSSNLELAGTASDGKDAVEKIEKLRPDVVLLDLEMPNMDGLTFIDHVMSQSPLPIIVCSSYSGGDSERGADVIFESLDAGAVDFIPMNPSVFKIGSDDNKHFISRIEQAAKAEPKLSGHHKPRLQNKVSVHEPQTSHTESNKVIIIGSSTGGPQVVTKIFAELPSDLSAPVLVVQHMPKEFTKQFAAHLAQVSGLEVTEAQEGEKLMPGKAIVAPGGYHMLVNKSKRVTMVSSQKRHGVRPSINMTMISASQVFGSGTVGVLLSGMGQDGAFGLTIIKRRGGKTIAQDKGSSVIFGMAKAATDLGAVDQVVPADDIAKKIVQAVGAQA